MLSILGAIVAVLVLAVLGVAVAAAMRPAAFQVQRSAVIQAPPEAIYALIEDFRRWRAWSPWETKDPNLQRTYSGAASGVGAVYDWTGNSTVGTGRMEIIEAVPARKVTIKLDFIKPIEGHNTAEFVFEEQGGATRVAWTMRGRAGFIGKLIGLFFSMDTMVGPDFEAGLANLQSVAEKGRA
jgi:uncharacterized protein YndB with AHSA1/START domain